MPLLMGPVLSFRGNVDGNWLVSALVVSNDMDLTFEWSIDAMAQPSINGVELLERGGSRVIKFVIRVAQGPDAKDVECRVGGVTARFEVPRRSASPQMAYASCNGFSSLKLMKSVKDKNALWSHMRSCHEERTKYHLLLLGGDQVYSDSMWEVVPELRAWNQLPWKEANKRAFTVSMAQQVETFFFKLYVERWAQAEVAWMLSHVPTIAMWDDHDILDGWGSYPEDRQNCPVFQGIARVATRMFRVFQHHLADGETHPASLSSYGLSLGFQVGRVGLLALDMRSERTQHRVLGPQHWNDVYSWLLHPAELDHLIVMSSIPVVYPGFDTLERIFGSVPGQQELEDDLKDHWSDRAHKGERLRFVHRLLDAAEVQRVRPTIVSGDVHVAALGVIESDRMTFGGERAIISQLISSGIVHPAPPKSVVFALRHLFDSTDELEPGIRARMTDFPGNASNFIGKRNFLSLEPDTEAARRRIWANWFVEGETEPLVKVILPMSPTVREAAKQELEVVKRLEEVA